jgi:hypothetical protein
VNLYEDWAINLEPDNYTKYRSSIQAQGLVAIYAL